MRNSRMPPLDSRLCLQADVQHAGTTTFPYWPRHQTDRISRTTCRSSLMSQFSICSSTHVRLIKNDEHDLENIRPTFPPNSARTFDIPQSDFIRRHLGATVVRLSIALRKGVASNANRHDTGTNGQPRIHRLSHLQHMKRGTCICMIRRTKSTKRGVF